MSSYQGINPLVLKLYRVSSEDNSPYYEGDFSVDGLAQAIGKPISNELKQYFQTMPIKLRRLIFKELVKRLKRKGVNAESDLYTIKILNNVVNDLPVMKYQSEFEIGDLFWIRNNLKVQSNCYIDEVF